MLFAKDHDDMELRTLAHSMSIAVATIQARCIDAVARGDMSSEDFIPGLASMLKWQDRSSIIRVIGDQLATFVPGGQRTSALLGKYCTEGQQRYGEILERTLRPMAFCLIDVFNRDGIIMGGHDPINVASAWCDWSSEPADLPGVQFFETVGLLMEEPGRPQDAMFAQGRLRCAIARGRERQITTDDGGARTFDDITAFLSWLG